MLSIYVIILILILVWTIVNGFSLPLLKTSSNKELDKNKKVSILIPMRNEERNIAPLIDSLKELTYENMEFIFLNDGSKDRTKELFYEKIEADNRFTLIEGKPLPSEWIGKVHACYQLSKKTTGDYLLFLDADVRVHPRTIERSLQAFSTNTGLVTGFPRYPLKSFLGHLLVPMQHFVVYLHLPVFLANLTTWPAATAAHGAYMMFRRDAYEKAGGHEKVKNSLVEDVHITREIKKNGYQVKLVNNTNTVLCHMYETNKEVWEGFSKNLFPGLGRNPFLVIALVIFYFIFMIFPFPLAIYGIFTLDFLLILPLLLTMMIKLFIDIMTRQKWWLFVVTPFSLFFMVLLMVYSTYLGLSNKGFTWKGRTYQ
ncbi:glycosyltransferase [Salipaludibacillus daqingensis]|uniref:glycosyltransferase n=1 Tax=Salipaludibacillus daqingensis TaxID=3041001 RepID=UPI0024760EC9|nr:glycosyltransferase family 2 protein [Salipaludibacillus daqingensis]